MSKMTFDADYQEYKRRLLEALPNIMGSEDITLEGLKLEYKDYSDLSKYGFSCVPVCEFTIIGTIKLSILEESESESESE